MHRQAGPSWNCKKRRVITVEKESSWWSIILQVIYRSSMSSLSPMAAAAAAAAAAASTTTSASKMAIDPAAGTRNCLQQVSSIRVSSSSANRHNIALTYSINSMKQSSPPPLRRLGAQAGPGISETFSNLRTQGKVAFIPYITAGDPDLSTTAKALKILSSCGADVIELGLPFSDPLMDGPVIQASNKRALASKTNVKAVISMLKEVAPQISCPIVIFSYYNLILSHESEWFFTSLGDAGVQGLMVPDLPFEESARLKEEAAKKNIDMVFFTTPTTTRMKMKAIADASEGFIYLVSSTGVTGARSTVDPQVECLLKKIKNETTKPVAVGFGISKPEHVKQISSWGADGVIVGSAIVKVLGEAKSEAEGLKRMECFVKSLVAALPQNTMHRHHHEPHTCSSTASLLGDRIEMENNKRDGGLLWHGPHYDACSSSTPNLLASQTPTPTQQS